MALPITAAPPKEPANVDPHIPTIKECQWGFLVAYEHLVKEANAPSYKELADIIMRIIGTEGRQRVKDGEYLFIVGLDVATAYNDALVKVKQAEVIRLKEAKAKKEKKAAERAAEMAAEKKAAVRRAKRAAVRKAKRAAAEKTVEPEETVETPDVQEKTVEPDVQETVEPTEESVEPNVKKTVQAATHGHSVWFIVPPTTETLT